MAAVAAAHLATMADESSTAAAVAFVRRSMDHRLDLAGGQGPLTDRRLAVRAASTARALRPQ
jgi:hypothetical protein